MFELTSNPTVSPHLINSIISVIFYLIMAAFMLYSLQAIYTVLRFGRSKILAIIVCIVYLIISASLYFAAINYLERINL